MFPRSHQYSAVSYPGTWPRVCRAAVRTGITIVADLLDESPFGSPSATFAELYQGTLSNIFDKTGAVGLSSAPDGSGPLLGAESVSTLEKGGTYYLVGGKLKGTRAQVTQVEAVARVLTSAVFSCWLHLCCLRAWQ